jgi:hypothetical protein
MITGKERSIYMFQMVSDLKSSVLQTGLNAQFRKLKPQNNPLYLGN